MKTISRSDTIYFTVKGQVVIPSWLRKEFGIEKDTRAIVYKEGDHIVLKPMTREQLKSLRGSLKGKGVLQGLMADRKREREL
ncbi:MAG: AbrB/MazE/SpoVT family DNA-binding domain-containing protein [Burkholderiales bacterium]|nr:AbrB/MazE/SpoVT family DNA-binding domain-containing protein [Burkholderiales bacterium]